VGVPGVSYTTRVLARDRARTRGASSLSETYVRVQLSWPAAQSNRIAELAIATVLGYFLFFYMLPTVTMLWVGYYYHGQYLCKHALGSGFARLVHNMVMLLLYYLWWYYYVRV